MKSHAVFSAHAREHVEGPQPRLRLCLEGIAYILNSGAATPLGCQKRSPKEHYLFYSPPDDSCFVAVQDRRNGYVITILPAEFDRHFKISRAMINAHLAQGRLAKIAAHRALQWQTALQLPHAGVSHVSISIS